MPQDATLIPETNPSGEPPGQAADPAKAESSDVLRSRIAKGSLWTLVGYGAGQAIRLLGNLILWRLLYAEAFGLMALVNVLIQGLAMFSDIGIGPSIVQHKRGEDPRYLNTAWTIQVVRGFALFIAAIILTAPMAAFYDEEKLLFLVPVAATGTILAGFNSTALFTQTRKIALGRLTFLDLAAQVVSLLAMIGWAWVYRSIWAILVGGIIGNVLRLVLSHTFLPGIRNRFCWDRENVKILIRFGRWIFFSTLLTFLVMQSDRLIFGKLIPMAMLGVYSIANTWATLPLTVLDRIFSAVLFPLLSRLHHEHSDFSQAFLKARRPWMMLAGWATAGLIAGGPTLIHLLYDERATSAGWIIQVLSAGIWFLVLETANGTALLALGQPKWVAAGNAAKLIGMVALIPIGFVRFGFPGAVVGFAASELLRYATSVVGAKKHNVACFGEDMALTGLVATTSTLGLVTARWLAGWLHHVDISPARVGTFIEGLGIAVCVSSSWAVLLVAERARRRKQEAALQP